MGRTAIIVIAAATLSACGGVLTYTPPTRAGNPENVVTATVDGTRREVWNRFVAELGRLYFVIGDMDRDAGIINARNRGDDPLGYIDCGHIRSRVRNVHGDRTYSFAAAVPEMQYEIMTDLLYAVTRRMKLDGRADIVLEAAGPDTVRITVRTRYFVTRTMWISGVDGSQDSSSDSISFSTGGRGRFADDGTICVATGVMERDILKLAR